MDNLKAVWLIFFVKPEAPLEIVRLEVCIHRIFLIQFMGYVGGQYAQDSRMVESGWSWWGQNSSAHIGACWVLMKQREKGDLV